MPSRSRPTRGPEPPDLALRVARLEADGHLYRASETMYLTMFWTLSTWWSHGQPAALAEAYGRLTADGSSIWRRILALQAEVEVASTQERLGALQQDAIQLRAAAVDLYSRATGFGRGAAPAGQATASEAKALWDLLSNMFPAARTPEQAMSSAYNQGWQPAPGPDGPRVVPPGH